MAKIGDIIYINFTFSEPVFNASCSINSKSASFSHLSNLDYFAYFTLTSGDTDWTSGNLPFTCTFNDVGGNPITQTTYTTANTLTGDANPLSILTATLSPSR